MRRTYHKIIEILSTRFVRTATNPGDDSTLWMNLAGDLFLGALPIGGSDGGALLSGEVDPTTEGADGDFWLNTATSTLFGPKAAGTWPVSGIVLGGGGSILDNYVTVSSQSAAGTGLFAQNRFVYAEGSSIRLSEDGGNGLTASSPRSISRPNQLAFGNGVFVGFVEDGAGVPVRSVSGLTWDDATTVVELNIGVFNPYHGRFVGITATSGASRYSTDGDTWVAGGALPGGDFRWARAVSFYSLVTAVSIFEGLIAVSSDGGESWAAGTALPERTDFQDEWEFALPVSGAILYFTRRGQIARQRYNYGPVYAATDSILSLYNANMEIIGVTKTEDLVIVTATVGGQQRLFSSADNGTTWTQYAGTLAAGLGTPLYGNGLLLVGGVNAFRA